jgi:hypothetical protein
MALDLRKRQVYTCMYDIGGIIQRSAWRGRADTSIQQHGSGRRTTSSFGGAHVC